MFSALAYPETGTKFIRDKPKSALFAYLLEATQLE
jgi:hypothetical protein